MEKFPLAPADHELVAAAVAASRESVMQLWNEKSTPHVAAAARLDDGAILTGLNVTADVGSLSVCAEPNVIAQVNRMPDRRIETLVAIYHDPGLEPKIVPPCGRCREFITDYAPHAFIILREPGGSTLFRLRAADLLPYKYGDFWRHRELI